MKTEIRKLMGRIQGRLDRYVGMEMTHCGHEEPANRAYEARLRLLDFIETEIEKLSFEHRHAAPKSHQ